MSNFQIAASRHVEIVEHLAEAFRELSNAGNDTLKMAEAIGGARALVAIALRKLGEPGPMQTLDAELKSFHESLSNSAGTLPTPAKESATASGGQLTSLLDSTGPEFEALFAAAITPKETY